MKDINQIVCDRLDAMNLSSLARMYVDETGYHEMAEVWGSCKTTDDVEELAAAMHEQQCL